MHEKLGDQPQCHQAASHVGRDGGGIAHHLQDGALIARFKARLEKCFAVVAERIVHVNQDVAVIAGGGIVQMNPAGEISWNIRAGIQIVIKGQQGDVIRLVIPNRAQRDLPRPSAKRETLRLGERGAS